MIRPRVLVDLSQFMAFPATSGVQRVLLHVLEGLRRGPFDAYVGALCGECVDIVRLDAAASTIGELFAATQPLDRRRDLVNSRFQDAKLFSCFPTDIDLLFDAYLLPEPTYAPETLALAEALRNRATIAVLLLAYDIIPISEPWLLHGRHQMRTDRYFRLLASAENVACISAQVGRDLVSRLRRSATTNPTVLPLGADGLGHTLQRQAPSAPMFVTIGTVEPRKNIPILLEAMRTLWAGGGEHQLTLIGAAGWEDDPFLGEFRGVAASDSRLTWLEGGDDELVKRTIEGATALVFPSEHEGFGLPPLEALALGVPVITAANLPALDGLSPGGQIRISDMTSPVLAEALTEIAEPRINWVLRQQIESLNLPTWRDFYGAMNSWVDDTIHQTETRRRFPVATER